MAQNERENFYRNSTVIVDQGKEVLGALLDNELSNHNITFPNFINQHQHDIYHLCFNRNPCCLCINGLLPRNVPKCRVIHENQLDLLFDRSGQKLSGHNSKSWSIFCCLSAKQTATIEQLDVTLVRCLLVNFSTNCTSGSLMRNAVDDLIGYRNKLYGHVEVARISDIDYNLNRPQIECRILDIAKFCKIENMMRQKLQDAYIRPLDQALCSQYQNVLLDEIRRTEKLETEFKSLLTNTECRIREHIDTISLHIDNINMHCKHHDAKLQSIEDNLKSEIHEERGGFEIKLNEHRLCLENTDKQVEKVNLYCEQLDAKLQSIESNLKTEIHDQQSKFEIAMQEHRQIMEDTEKTVKENVWKKESSITGEIHETAASLENKIDKYQKHTDKQIQNLRDTVEVTISDPRIKQRTSDYRKDNLTAHTNARLQYHQDDKTFVKTRAAKFAEEILEKQKILILLAKAGSGKSTISLHLASTYKAKRYVPLLFIDKDIIQYRDLVSVNEKSLFVVEDLFGRSNVQYEDDVHKNILDVLMSLMNSPSIRLIITIKNCPTCEEHILQKHDIFNGKCIMNLDSDWTLSDNEKICILLRHMEHNSITKCAHPLNIDVCLDYDLFSSCLSCTEAVLELPGGHIQVCTDLIYLVCSFDTYIGFPETCRMFCSNKRFTLLGVDYFRRTTHSLLNTINELFTNSFGNLNARYQYCLLVYTAMHKGILHFTDIYKNFDKDTLLLSLFSIFDDANIRIRRQLIQSALKELEGTYLITGKRFNEECFAWTGPLKEDAYFFIHQSIFEAVLISFGTECPKELLDLEICNITFIGSYIRPSHSSCRDVETPILFVDSEVLLAKIFNILRHDSWLTNVLKTGKITGMTSFSSEVRYQYTVDKMEKREENLGNNTTNKCLEVLKNEEQNKVEHCDKETLELTIPQENHVDKSERSEEAISNISDDEFSSSVSTGNGLNEVENDDCKTDEESENDDCIIEEETENDDCITEGESQNDYCITEEESQNDDCITEEESQTDDCITEEESENEVDEEQWPKEDGHILHRYWCGESERVGMFIRTCIIESHHEEFVRSFFERLPISSLIPRKITDILNGLSRRGTCSLNLQLKIDKLKDYILNYGTVKVCSLLLRPQSSNAMSHIYYQIDSDTIRKKLFALMNDTSEYAEIEEIGKYLLKISVDDDNEKFVNNFLNEVIVHFNANDRQKIMYLLDGLCDKRRCKELMSHFRDFLNSNLLQYGSINVILILCSIKNSHITDMCNIEIEREDFIKILTYKFCKTLFCLTEYKYGVTLKTQIQELGSSVYEFGIKINDDAFVEELISAVVKCYDLYIYYPNLIMCHYNLKFLLHFTEGFTECDKRLKSAQEKYPLSMDLLETHCARYITFERSVRKQVKKLRRGNIWAQENFIFHVNLVHKLKLDANDFILENILNVVDLNAD